jgi:hypothetical protein
MKPLATVILTIIFSNFLAAQSSEIGNWFIYFGNQKINEKWNWHNEVQYRNFNFVGDLEQLLLRTGIGYNLSQGNNNLLLGYAYIHSQPYVAGTDEKQKVDEHRLFQQFITRQNFGRFYLQHRYRVEQRFIEDDFRMRYRYFLALNIPLNKSVMQKNALYASTYNEIFINGSRNIFDRNRLYGALGYCISDHVRVELGAMTQILADKSRAQFQIVIFNNLPVKKGR